MPTTIMLIAILLALLNMSLLLADAVRDGSMTRATVSTGFIFVIIGTARNWAVTLNPDDPTFGWVFRLGQALPGGLAVAVIVAGLILLAFALGLFLSKVFKKD